jgi:hypothetical protein
MASGASCIFGGRSPAASAARSSAAALVTRRQTAAPPSSPISASFIGALGALGLSTLAVAPDHQEGDTPNVDFGDHRQGDSCVTGDAADMTCLSLDAVLLL